MDALKRLATSLWNRVNVYKRLRALEAQASALEAAVAAESAQRDADLAAVRECMDAIQARIERHTASANKRHAAMCAASGDYERNA